MPAAPLPLVRTVAALRAQVADWRAEGHRIGMVPTMGALHDGHLSLIRRARQDAGRVLASVFVNPSQFAPHEDFDAYPRDEARDAALLTLAGCDLLYAPTVAEMYPQGFATRVAVSGVSGPLEGLSRPGHFEGVATVVSKLLNQARPDVAVFGEKDYQQLQVIRRMALDLDLGVAIIGAETLRAEDGLALSSRNVYLSETERAVAGRLNVVMRDLAAAVAAGEAVAAAEIKSAAALLAAGFDSIDYIEVHASDDLRRLGPGPADAPARVLVAARIGKTRLIDNCAV